MGAAPPAAVGWRIGVDVEVPVGLVGTGGDLPPAGRLELWLHDCGVATSGARFQSAMMDGRRYTHFVNPTTGQSVSDPATATVIASDAMRADVLATCISILGPARGVAWADQNAAEALATCAASGEASVSRGFSRYLASPAVPSAAGRH